MEFWVTHQAFVGISESFFKMIFSNEGKLISLKENIQSRVVRKKKKKKG